MPIGFNQAENLFGFAKRNGFNHVYAELERIGINNLMNLMGPDQQRRLIHYMAGNEPIHALVLLSKFPSDKSRQDNWCCGVAPDEAGLCPVCREHIN